MFVAAYPQARGGNDVNLLGSTCHILDRVGSVGRTGPNSVTLYERASYEDLIDRRSGGQSWEVAGAANHRERVVTEEGPR